MRIILMMTAGLMLIAGTAQAQGRWSISAAGPRVVTAVDASNIVGQGRYRRAWVLQFSITTPQTYSLSRYTFDCEDPITVMTDYRSYARDGSVLGSDSTIDSPKSVAPGTIAEADWRAVCRSDWQYTAVFASHAEVRQWAENVWANPPG